MRFDSPVTWPDGVRCAALLTFNVDAELAWLNLHPSAADRPKTLSNGEYGPRRGVGRVLDVLDRYGVRATFLIPGANAVRYGEAVAAIHARGHEIGNHGDRHENLGLLTASEQREALRRGNEALERVTGHRPEGFRAPWGEITLETPGLLAELGFRWSSTTRGDDRPHFLDGPARGVVEIPTRPELDDFPYFMFNYAPPYPAGQGRIASYSQVLGIWQTEFDAYYERGLCFVLTLHPETIGTPGRIRLLEQFVEHVQSRPRVWIATCGEVAEWWRRAGRPNDPGHPVEIQARQPP